MKILEIDYDYYQFPQDVATVEEFVRDLNGKYNSFIPMVQYQTENCVFPYLIEEEIKTVHMNVAQMKRICDVEATVMSRADYDAQLHSVVQKKCIDCVNYSEDSEGDNLKGHRGKISLDGECWGYEKKTD